MDQEEAFSWILVIFAGLVATAAVVTLALVIAWQWHPSSAKQVILDKDGEWHCAKPALERSGG